MSFIVVSVADSNQKRCPPLWEETGNVCHVTSDPGPAQTQNSFDSLLQWRPCSDLFSLMIGCRRPSPWQRTLFIISPLFLLLLFSKSFFLSYQVFPPPLCSATGFLFDRKYSSRCGVVVDLRPWQTPSIRLICIHKSIGYLTLANTLGSEERWCWVGPVTLSLVMELWWSVTAAPGCWRTHHSCTVKNQAF